VKDITAAQGRILDDVLAERDRQEAKWGEQNHDPFTYLTILMEELGELAEAALHARFGGPAADGLRNEAIQTAAVAVAIVECLDRGKWSWRDDVDNNGNDRRLADLPVQAVACPWCLSRGVECRHPKIGD
jgi:NTP pyrophosphatase (non-canonical NTP hydrolase)